MSDYIDTRDGYREVDPESVGRHDLLLVDPETGRIARAWVREVPVAPLPTTPYTVIRATGVGRADGVAEMFLDTNRGWCYCNNGARATYLDRITGFEVLSEPRAVTAKAVLDRTNELLDGDTPWISVIMTVAREFGNPDV